MKPKPLSCTNFLILPNAIDAHSFTTQRCKLPPLKRIVAKIERCQISTFKVGRRQSLHERGTVLSYPTNGCLPECASPKSELFEIPAIQRRRHMLSTPSLAQPATAGEQPELTGPHRISRGFRGNL